MSNIRELLLQTAPKFAEDYANYVRDFYNEHIEEIGHKWLNGMYDGRRNRWNGMVYHCFVRAPGESEYAPHPERVFSEEKLAENAKRYGEEIATEWANKIEGKLADVTGLEFRTTGNGEFQFTGTREGHTIQLNQQTVSKVSRNGKWFHQFPARIYVDGQFTSEKAYKAMFAS